MTKNTKIHSFRGFIPQKTISTQAIEEEVAKASSVSIQPGVIKLMTGITNLPRADEDMQASDLACRASESLLKTKPDLLIFASASQDISEPATAHILQQKLKLDCPVFDVKNACNSFLNGLQIATGFVEAGIYKNVLVATGEIPSRVLVYDFRDRQEYKASFASLTLGDGGGAALVSFTEKTNILYQQFYSYGQNWHLAAFMGGGSMFPRDPEYMRFTGDGTKLKNSFLKLGGGIIEEALQSSHLRRDDIDQFFLHQVAGSFTDETIAAINLPLERTYRTVEKHGNLASASLPVALWQAQKEGVVKTGDTVFILGLASGTSIGIFILKI